MAGQSATAKVRSRKMDSPRVRAVAYLFVLPAVLFTILFEYVPMFDGIYHAFFRWNGANLERFVGLDNFREIFRDDVFWISVQNMLFFLVFNLILMIPTLIACIVLVRIKNQRTQYLYRILYCLPMVIPAIVTLLLWQFMYNPQYGFFNQFLTSLGFENLKQLWLGDPNLVKWCILFISFPWIVTVHALIYLGGLQSVDSSIWDAGDIDGVGPFKRAWYLELPLVKGQFKLNLIGVISGTVTGYGTQLILTEGGPGYSTLVPGLYMYQKAFGKQTDFGYASAVGLVLFVIALLISVATMKYIRSED